MIEGNNCKLKVFDEEVYSKLTAYLKKVLVLFVCICLLAIVLDCVYAQDAEDSIEWKMTLTTHTIWIGEPFEIHVNGTPESWVTIKMRNYADGNISINRDVITDTNGSATFKFSSLETEVYGQYYILLFVGGNSTPLITDMITINYDEDIYQFILFEKWSAYMGIDIEEYDPMHDRDFTDREWTLTDTTRKADEKATKALLLFTYLVPCGVFFVIFITWLFWDDIAIRWERKRENAMLPKSRLMNAIQLKPRTDLFGQRLMNRHPQFKNDGRTKHEREKMRQRLLKKHGIRPETMELMDKELDGKPEHWYNRLISLDGNRKESE